MSGPSPRSINTLPEATSADSTDLMILRHFDSGIWRDTKITIENLKNSLDIDSPWIEITSTSEPFEPWGKYVANNSSLITFSLPITADFGTEIEVKGMNTGGWSISQASGQSINYGDKTTTIGISGSLSSTKDRDAVRLVCVVADTTWDVVSSIGNLEFV